MDGKGRWMDNRFIERLWRSLKYEAVYLEELCGGQHARRVIGAWLDHYNHRRPHLAFAGKTLVPAKYTSPGGRFTYCDRRRLRAGDRPWASVATLPTPKAGLRRRKPGIVA